jgi:UDP-GlcNAc:undecaprenyl-phosphate GlcNAc-1-phosphate transferase
LAALAFLVVSIPSESVYVNVAAAAVAGASLAFLPHNFSKDKKIFMGDAGSLTLGFWLSALALGVEYTRWTSVGVLAPLLILGVPIYDTFFVSFIRILQGKSPFLGSKDHMALKLRAMGLSTRQVVAVFAVAALGLSSCAYLLTLTPYYVSLLVVGATALVGVFVLVRLYDVKVH